MSFTLLDDVANLLAAASRATDPAVRAIYLAEARMRVEQAKAKAKNLDELVSAAEGEMARLAREASR